jgi:chemotaxis protein MotB
MFKKTPAKQKKNTDDWLITYADIVTLLMAFFVLILAVSKIDQEKVEQMHQGVAKDILKKEYAQPFRTLKEKIDKVIKNQKLEKMVNTELNPLGIKIRFRSTVLYDSGSAEIKTKVFPFLKKVSKIVSSGQYSNYLIEVDGHTDNRPISTTKYPSNWELSSARATHIVRYFVGQGIPKEHAKASGYADSRPERPNISETGEAIQSNQAFNRRVEVFILREKR